MVDLSIYPLVLCHMNYIYKWVDLSIAMLVITRGNSGCFPMKMVDVSIAIIYLGKITMFNGQIHYKRQFSVPMLNYQRVIPFKMVALSIVIEAMAQ